ncbi:MAG: hypothetical protein AAF415_18035 [Pseudomonadota bacterium]
MQIVAQCLNPSGGNCFEVFDMDPKALAQARERVERMAAAIAEMEKTDPSMVGFERHWIDFLLAHNTIFTKLEQGAKGNGRSQGWFGEVKSFRKQDELLRYLHHARNCAEHSLETTTLKQEFDVVPQTAWTERIPPTEASKGVPGLRGYVGKPFSARIVPPGVRLRPVSDRGVEYLPPERHLGVELWKCDPLSVAKHAFDYLECLVTEAEEQFGVEQRP